MFGPKPKLNYISVVPDTNMVIEDKKSTVEMFEKSASIDEFTRILEFMEYYQFDFDSIPSIPLSQTEVPTFQNMVPSTPSDLSSPIAPRIPSMLGVLS